MGDETGTANLGTKLALDRTTLAWVRTTLTMASFGFGMVALFRSLDQHMRSI
jgi:putative membrane protein